MTKAQEIRTQALEAIKTQFGKRATIDLSKDPAGMLVKFEEGNYSLRVKVKVQGQADA